MQYSVVGADLGCHLTGEYYDNQHHNTEYPRPAPRADQFRSCPQVWQDRAVQDHVLDL
jgi:hypothetical protein